MVSCKGGHSKRFKSYRPLQCFDKIAEVRFETKIQIMFNTYTNDGFDKLQQVSSSCHFWLQSLNYVQGNASNLSLFVFVLLLISVYLSVHVLKCWLKMCKCSWSMAW